MVDLLSIGNSGLGVSKKGMDTTGHNIANANTEGYSRQRVDITTKIPITKEGLIQGTGARVAGINRINDEFIEKRLNLALTENKYSATLADRLSQLEGIFNEVDGEGFNKILSRFFNSFSELAANPENEAIRSYVRENATTVAGDFARINEALGTIDGDVDTQIQIQVEDINELAKQIAKLNKKIQIMEATGSQANDLRDQRDLAVRNISQFLKISTYEDNQRNYNVHINGAGTLVAGPMYQKLKAVIQPKEKGSISEGMQVYFEKKSNFPITNKIKDGSLGAAIHAKQNIVGGLRNKLDNIAYHLTKVVNSIHQKGFVNRQLNVAPEKEPPLSDSFGPTTGINFFKEMESSSGASSQVELSQEVKDDLSNISTGLLPNKPGDNRVALAISKIPHQKILDNGRATLEEEYLKSISDVGLASSKARLGKEQADGILAQIKSLKERVSGVSLDEEATNLIRFQNAYQASAKVIKEADEMFKAVLDLKS